MLGAFLVYGTLWFKKPMKKKIINKYKIIPVVLAVLLCCGEELHNSILIMPTLNDIKIFLEIVFSFIKWALSGFNPFIPLED